MHFDIDNEHIEAVEAMGTYLEVEEVAKSFSFVTSKDTKYNKFRLKFLWVFIYFLYHMRLTY
jgi:hypothetical protein